MLEQIFKDVLEGNASRVSAGVREALAAGHDPSDILNQGLIAAMEKVGCQFEAGQFYVPEMLISARAMKQGLEVLKPALIEADVKPVGKVILGTVTGDLHDIGKNLVGMMLEGAGFEVIDLGVEVTPEQFVMAVRKHQAGFVGLSALLTTTMPGMDDTIAALKEAGLRGSVKVMVGGAPVTQAFADQIGADLYAPDAPNAASRVKELLTCC